MKRWLVLLYGVLAYLVFFAVFLWSVAFVGNFWVPVSLDAPQESTLAWALLINFGLLGLFAVQHSLMARPFFKTWIEKFIPQAAERSNYVMASNSAMILLLLFWQPMGPEVWRISHPVAFYLMCALFFAGWGMVFVSTCLINHFDLFGLRQVWFYFRKEEYRPLKFAQPGLYKYVRHPLYVGWLTVFWSAPVMSLSHLVFAVGCTGYILIAIRWEERDLIDALGVEYSRYRDEVPMFIPNFGTGVSESGVHSAGI